MVKYLALLLAGILAASCIFDADQCVMPADQPHAVMFTVALDEQRTKAPWSDSYDSETGVPFDYRIIPEELRVVVYAEDGTRVGVLQDLGYWPIDEAHTKFQFVGQLPPEFVEHFNANSGKPNYRFMVLANCGDHSAGEEYISYSQAQLDPTAANSAIPMWGVKEADVTPLLNDDSMNIGEIWLLRAAAKIEVKLSDNLKDKETKINSATLKYYNQTGYVLPSGWSEVSDTEQLDQQGCMRLYRHAALNMPFVVDNEGDKCYIYVTEYDNVSYPGERNKISLEFNMGGKIKYFEDAISFCHYSNGSPIDGSHYNIVRNHIYQFDIRNIAGSSLALEYTVADWTAEDWDGNGTEHEEHDLSYPTYHNPVVPFDFLSLTASEQSDYIISQEPTMHYSAGHPEDGGFHCYFQILAPELVEWKPVFMGSKENYRIRVYHLNKSLTQSSDEPIYDTGNDKLQGNLTACGVGEWYHIVIFPLSDDGADNTTIEFGISYYQQWTDQYINLYVNGEYNNIRWPNSGNNPKIIDIKHISAK